jgi:hypothetical protein
MNREQDLAGVMMADKGVSLGRVLADAELLSREDRLRLIKSLAETLISRPTDHSCKPLQFGEFKGAGMSTDEDFAIAEWRPAERDLDGK